MGNSIQDSLIQFQYFRDGHEIPLELLEKHLNTNISDGLTSSQVENLKNRVVPNKIITPRPGIWRLYLAPLFDTLITVYLLMTLIMIILAIWVDGIFTKISFWLVMIFLNMVLAIFQQFRAQKKLDALQGLSPPKAKVIRNGKLEHIFALELLPGDLIELETGDKVPADCRLVETYNMTVNEASLTGESLPVEKNANSGRPIEKELPISQHTNFVYLGTFIQQGVGTAVVVRTGNETELGRIASAMGEMNTLDIPLRRKVNSLGRKLTLVMLFFLIIKTVHSIYILRRYNSFTIDVFATQLADSIITAMAVIPINIPLLTTVVLLSGVLAMAQNRVVVKNLATIETLGRCSVLCSDKTGTMTTSNMSVKLINDTTNYYGVELDEEYRNRITFIPKSEISAFLNEDHILYPPFDSIKSGSPLELLLTSAVLNNEAKLIPKESSDGLTRYDIVGDTTDAALLQLALAQGYSENEIKNRYKRQKHYPFNSSLKRMSGLFHDSLEDDWMVLSKGATEVILARCTQIGDEVNTITLTDHKRNEILDIVNIFADEGYRVISLAYKSVSEIPEFPNGKKEREFMEASLTFIGFAVIFDPPRPGVREAVAKLDSAGIFPVMITGDSPKTAETIGKQVGILDPDELVVEGSSVSELSDDEFYKVSVFARVSPKDKETIVKRYQDRGDVVAMTGDGVNDAFAITRADAGVSMGITGTQVTKEAADIIITDDSYISLVRGVDEGRNLYEKIRIMIFFYLAVNLAEALLYFSASFILDFGLITQWQRIFIFTIVHAFPVLAIIFGPPDKQMMELNPRNNDSLIPRQMAYAIIVFSFSYFFSLALLYYITFQGVIPIFPVNNNSMWGLIESSLPSDPLHPGDIVQAKARTMLISTMYLTESFIIFSIRRFNSSILKGTNTETNIFVWATVLAGPILLFATMYITSIQENFINLGLEIDLLTLGVIDLILVFIFASFPIIILELFKKNRRENNIQF